MKFVHESVLFTCIKLFQPIIRFKYVAETTKKYSYV